MAQSYLSKIAPPMTEASLLERACSLSGQELGSVAKALEQPVPTQSLHAKGWAGKLLEIALGAKGTSEPEPDFPHLGIELKTLPILPNGRIKESTYICVAPLENPIGITWEQSLVQRKLARVLWIPLLSSSHREPRHRVIGSPLLWSPDKRQDKQLRKDWEELMEFITLGRVHQLSAHHGHWLQIRPKAASAKSLTWSSNAEGERIQTNPRGFYLRTSFTDLIVKKYFVLPNKS